MSVIPIFWIQGNHISTRLSDLIKMEELDSTCFYGLAWQPGCWLEAHLYGKTLAWAPGRWTKAHSQQSQIWSWLFVNTKQKHERELYFLASSLLSIHPIRRVLYFYTERSRTFFGSLFLASYLEGAKAEININALLRNYCVPGTTPTSFKTHDNPVKLIETSSFLNN